jgi:hypothetical protein
MGKFKGRGSCIYSTRNCSNCNIIVLSKLGYYASRADPCIFIRKDNQRYSYLIVYVDDGGICGSQEDIKVVIKPLSDYFVVKDLGEMWM